MWSKVGNNIPYGFAGTLQPGTYVIADNDLGRVQLMNGIWKDDESSIATLGTELGYFKIYKSQKIYRFGVNRRISIIPIKHVIEPSLGYTFTSNTDIMVHANEMYGTLDIRYNNDEHIFVEYDDPEQDYMY